MAERITNENLSNAVEFYRNAAEAAGVSADKLDGIQVCAPYGQVLYLLRYDATTHAYHHDLPGFVGSGGSGFTSKRAAYDAIRLAARTLADLAYQREG